MIRAGTNHWRLARVCATVTRLASAKGALMKRWLVRALWCVAVAAGGLVGAGGVAVPAAAAPVDAPEAWGYVYLNEPNPSGEYTPPMDRQANSAGAPTTVRRTGPGRYLVTFWDVESPDYGTLHVTSDLDGVSCRSEGSNNYLGDADGDQKWDYQVGVVCRNNATAAPADARFTAIFRTRLAPLAAGTPGAYAYLIADEPEKPDYEPYFYFSSSGTAPRVVKAPGTTGRWNVFLNGTAFTGPGGNVQVTSYQGAVICAAFDWHTVTTGTVATVECRAAGAGGALRDDAMFTLTYSRELSLFGTMIGQAAYLRTDRPDTGPYWYSNTGALPTVVASPTPGVYDLTAPLRGPASSFTIQVTPVSPSTVTCATTQWYTTRGGPTGTQAVGQVRCDQAGAGTATSFSLSFST
jgi:hypothetical protein